MIGSVESGLSVVVKLVEVVTFFSLDGLEKISPDLASAVESNFIDAATPWDALTNPQEVYARLPLGEAMVVVTRAAEELNKFAEENAEAIEHAFEALETVLMSHGAPELEAPTQDSN